MLENKRGEERYPLKLPANIVVRSDDNHRHEYLQHTDNISSSGAYFSTDEPIPNGTEVELDILLPAPKSQRQAVTRGRVHVSGIVVRSDHEGMAIKFSQKSQLSAMRLI